MQGYILAGGLSSRMGRDKNALMLGQSAFIDRASDAMSAIGDEGVVIVGGTAGGSHGLAVIADSPPAFATSYGGAIIGLFTALTVADSEWIAVLACDLPFVTGEFLNGLAGLDRSGFDAVVPVQQDGIPQPLCALYRCETCLPAVLKSIGSKNLSLRSMLRQVRTRFVDLTEINGRDDGEKLFLNVNTPQDYQHALLLAGA